ncbi:selenocysteine-specific translation elongation factor [Helicobacter cetorum]|uniref:Selenocysteine-specific elongation factor n=1 Tax=Helicobacter cetorum (strain ATCC BAA-429 / MIT 00-7128) TaxID=182217 RepID=I0ELX3_HELC0|nr:selenocysteine-specific translation elongation factor [Helicobacter cetorum]AFI03942.1 selenocysteine-specific translation elongation factor [Helicobacter cetorum MIT 00-7128]
MEYLLVGVLGHIDHGKSSLIKAMNGFWGDSSKEEMRRSITIEPSFSHLELKNRMIAFVDTPGHESLISKTINASLSLDLSLLVVDINEGIMPQTNEHLLILNALNIPFLLVLNKCDLCQDLESKKAQILKNLPQSVGVVETSIYDSKSIENLKQALLNYKITNKNGNRDGFFRMYVDNVLHKHGYGTIILGTIYQGIIHKGDKIFINDLKKESVVRALQVHKVEVTNAQAHSRVALNLKNIETKELKNGMCLSPKAKMRGFDKIDIFTRTPLKHLQCVNIQISAKKSLARVLDLGGNFYTLELEEPFFVCFKDLGVVSVANRVVGGLEVLNPITDPLNKALKLELLKALKLDDFKKAFELLALGHLKGFGLGCVEQRFNLKLDEALEIAKETNLLLDEENVTLYSLKALERRIKFYRSKLSSSTLFGAGDFLSLQALETLRELGALDKKDGLYLKKGLKIDSIKNKLSQSMLELLENPTPLAPYNLYETLDLDKVTGDNLLKSLTKAKKVVRLNKNVFVGAITLSKILAQMRSIILKDGFIDVSNFKKHLEISRKYLINYLEYLDSFKDIKREKDRRYLG